MFYYDNYIYMYFKDMGDENIRDKKKFYKIKSITSFLNNILNRINIFSNILGKIIKYFKIISC